MTLMDALGQTKPGARVCAGIIGLGDFATAIVGQSTAIPQLEVQVGADIDAEAACDAFRQAGFAEAEIVVCETVQSALVAMERGARVVLPDPAMLMELPVDVVVEATGDAEAGARYALEAIRHGKHVAMVNKEADCVVGPILKRKADLAGVVYTAVDGDQHGLLIGLVAWARQIGFEVVCGGKFCDTEIRFDPATGSPTAGGGTLTLERDALRLFGGAGGRSASTLVAARAAILAERSQLGEFDYEELAIMANATGLAPDTPELHHPTLRLAEVPGVLCPVEEGGVLRTRGAIDAVIELRDSGVPGLGGGVFIVVSCANAYARETVLQKGDLPTNALGTAALIYRPYHFCGVEATLSILYAGLLQTATGASEYVPRFDVVVRATRSMAPGETLQLEDVGVALQSARPVGSGNPLPLRLAVGRPLAAPASPGDLITAETVVPPSDSILWSLRTEQDRVWLGATGSETGAAPDAGQPGGQPGL